MAISISVVKKKVMPVLKKHGVKKAAVFGSVATGEATAKSDVDILVEFKGKKSLLDLAGLELELEKKLGRKVDVLTFKYINPLIRERILSEQVPIL